MRRAIPLVCFFLSGAAGLIAEVCWIRQAALVFGSTTFATSTVVAVFFLGLAIGSWLFGRISMRTARPLRLYALLEMGLAALVLASPAAFEAADSIYGRMYRATSDAGGSTWLARIVLVGAAILPPTFLMGGTLPLFCKQYVQGPARIARTVGFLYGLNTLGAAVGCALAGFLLLPAVGMRRTLAIGAALSLLAGILALASRPVAIAPATASRRKVAASSTYSRGIVAALFFATGFVALGHEVLWTRFLTLVVHSKVHTYTLGLTVVLLGIVLGSWLASSFSDRVASRARLFGTLQILGALVMLATLLLPPRAWRILGSETWTCFALALVPAVLSGAAFPLAVRMVVSEPAFAGRLTGLLSAVNTLGGIAGSLLVGFIALPYLGLQRSVVLTTGIGLATGFAAWLALEERRRIAARAVAIVACLGVWLAIPRLLHTRVPADFLAQGNVLVDYREGLESNLAVVRKQRVLQLEADRWWQGQDRKTHQIMAAHLPMLLHPRPRRVLVVGVGAGQTPERVLLYDVERLDCVDIEPAVFDLVRRHFSSDWMRDPRVRLVREDGRNYIAHTSARYDVISLEVGQVFRPGVAAFYTADFYQRARARLEPGGLLSQFVPLAFLSPETFRSVVGSFLDAFPQSVLWYNTSELLLVGTNAERIEIDPARLHLLESNARIHADLSWSHWAGPSYWLNRTQVFLGGYLCGPRGLGALREGARVLRDDHPVLAYATRNANDQQANELPILELLQPRLEPVADVLRTALPDSILAAAATVRERNWSDMIASAHLRRVETLLASGRYDELEFLLRETLRANPENVEANRMLADLLLLRRRPDEAQACYARALTLSPQDAASHLGLALLLYGQNRFAAAAEHYRTGLEREPNDPEAHNNLGAALIRQGDLHAAVRHFEAALRLRPDYGMARQNLATVQEYLSRGAGAPSQSSKP